MGSLVVGRRWSRAGIAVALFLGSSAAWGQVPGAGPGPAAVPAPEPAPVPVTPVAPAPSPEPLPAAPPPPLDPPPHPETETEASTGPSFLKPREAAPRRRLDADESPSAPVSLQKALPRDFVLRATPWVDFTLTSFWMGDRSENFLNLGVQAGGYLFERLRVSGRLVVPVQEAEDQYQDYESFSAPGTNFTTRVPSRSVSALYGVGAGLILAASNAFLFAPGLAVWRTDVNDYGTTIALTLPFEWTTRRRLRVGFELALGHSLGGWQDRVCKTVVNGGATCGTSEVSRPGSTSVLLQYSMGWALSAL